MAKPAKKAGPRRGGAGDNALSMKEESAIQKKMLENMRLWHIKKNAFAAKMKLAWEKDVVGFAKTLGMTMADIKAFFEDHQIETGEDEDAVNKAANKRARRLNTYNRLYAATHDGAQLDWVDIQKQDDIARKEAEEEANKATEEEDSPSDD